MQNSVYTICCKCAEYNSINWLKHRIWKCPLKFLLGILRIWYSLLREIKKNIDAGAIVARQSKFDAVFICGKIMKLNLCAINVAHVTNGLIKYLTWTLTKNTSLNSHRYNIRSCWANSFDLGIFDSSFSA